MRYGLLVVGDVQKVTEAAAHFQDIAGGKRQLFEEEIVTTALRCGASPKGPPPFAALADKPIVKLNDLRGPVWIRRGAFVLLSAVCHPGP